MYIQPSIQPFHRARYVSYIDCVGHALYFLHTAWYKKVMHYFLVVFLKVHALSE